ncbi:MAG: conjugal transfer protein [Novosphingobium sp.]|uniref:Peptidase S26 n=1 Tax=Croceibacterium atlanticum TaxID=1267766 RepID=A0A0F7KWZ7_9SPHN|nr:S26 family signal peptidase [Croceibacterium atlanticum]AKH43747.1 Peptidase S26 [Croceibacterium atlanticum]MAC57589.1 conjugal transfer protein [Novosphingobium sp.]MBB5733806.1 conjugative transfer signal peptidase TraF [Croceibacterium atlanticum]
MTRFGYVIATVVTAQAFIVLFVTVALADPRPRVLWNASASAPIGFYRIHADDDPPSGALVAVTPPRPWARWIAERGYLPEGVPLLKHVEAKAGQRVCRIGNMVSVDRRPVAVALDRDSQGRPLPVWQGCHNLRSGEFLFMNPSVPDSLDGRYFGPLSATTLLGRATPMLTRDTADGPLIWRGIAP